MTATPITIEYRPTRADIWHLYWWLWRARLWRTQVVLFAGVIGACLLVGGIPEAAAGWLRVLGWAFVMPGFLILYPQLRYRPQLRTLIIDEAGMRTRIGNRSGTQAWKDVRSVDQLGDRIVIAGRNGNAFIIPPGAFEAPEAAARFLKAAEQRRAEATR